MILGIESSCDESAIALFDRERGLVGEWVSTQIALHAEYGGVVPDLASREHLNNFGPLLSEMETKFGLDVITEIAVTVGPGLAGCLAMGIAVADSLSVALGAPVRPVNHLRAHAHSVFISKYEDGPSDFDLEVEKLLPHLSLIVSGGNTILASIDGDRQIRVLGQTIDDAAGEALDKGAKLLGLGYPGGPKMEEWSQKGDSNAYDFPRALLHKPNFDFSFSGLKTSLRYALDKLDDSEIDSGLADICASYQEAVVDALIRKASKALKTDAFRSIGLSGGVSNNQLLRSRFEGLAKKSKVECFLAQRKHTGDNAGMIAFSHVFDNCAENAFESDILPGLTIEQKIS
ncbi:tRNA (adenosine(37)-N6)-threonylcarbamoyltransferase complex transferase subunit TsaD [Puniceicoccaceae bacterium K14]|nr:tRNA (adenosine(37)-N6)-threonylcarbamoyltransferase complex transferase subunit TsaD [Puniceicoccaceae bacterium K14]